MSAAASSSNRGAVYAALGRRNRLIAMLRIGVPVFGALVLIALLGQLIAASITNSFLPDGVRIERDTVIIDTPSYSGVMQDGTRYTVISQNAQAAVDGPDLIDLDSARIELLRPSGQEVVGEALAARFSLSRQVVYVDGEMHVTESGGSAAVLEESVFDWNAQSLDTKGSVQIEFADGSVLTAAGLHFDAASEEWDFAQVKLVVPGDAKQ